MTAAVRPAEVVGDPSSGLRSDAHARVDQQDGQERALSSHLSAKTAQPGRPRRPTCHSQRPKCNINLGFQPSKTLNLVPNPFPQPRVWPQAHPRTLPLPKPNRQVPSTRTQKWLASSPAPSMESCGVLQRTPQLVCATRTFVIWGGWPVWDVRQR